ncbi:hypothetical protein [Mucilaginibacter sp. L196]|uniref:hypothetical protein n=1 Tax=Mucilaginibacter sp. L196 TaxID=1641870 RepID=UPI00131BB1CB|nr:hypothetical protein [Mucilaginibacter sp. L196]
MKKTIQVSAIALISILFARCSFISNTFNYKDKTEEFVNAIVQKKYNKCISMMDQQSNLPTNPDTVKAALDKLSAILSQNFAGKLNYSLISSKKTFSTDKSESTPPGQTLVFVQIDNSNYVGEVKLMFDDKTLKITSFYIMDVYEQMGTMLYYWLFGILVLGVLAFNIYMIVQLKRSKAPKKWIGYLLIILLNVPTLSYFPISGFHFNLLSFQFLLGVSFLSAGYINSYLAFGFPLGGLIVLYKLKTTRYEDEFEDQTMLSERPEGAGDDIDNI